MSLVPRNSVLGALDVLEVFDTFDYPRLFLAASRLGALYLALSVIETDEELVWIYLPLSEERLRDLRESRLSLRMAFAEPEEGILEVRQPREGGESIIERRMTAPEEWLPEEGEYLHTVPRPLVARQPNRSRALAAQTWRDVVDLAFSFSDYRGFRAPLRALGELYSAFQQAVDVFGAATLGPVPARGPLPSELLEQTQLQLAGIYEGSFGATLSASSQADLFGTSLLGRAIENLIRVAELSGDSHRLVEELRRVGIRGAVRLRVFLEALDAARGTAEISWAAPTETLGRSVFISRDAINSALATLTAFELTSQPVIELTCRLIGVNVRTKSYEIVRTGDGQKYSGRVSDDAIADVSHATINDNYVARLLSHLEVNTTTGEERTRFLLLSLTPLGARAV